MRPARALCSSSQTRRSKRNLSLKTLTVCSIRVKYLNSLLQMRKQRSWRLVTLNEALLTRLEWCWKCFQRFCAVCRKFKMYLFFLTASTTSSTSRRQKCRFLAFSSVCIFCESLQRESAYHNCLFAHWRCVQNQNATVSVTYQLLHNRLVPGKCCDTFRFTISCYCFFIQLKKEFTIVTAALAGRRTGTCCK